ncbi:thiamine diphosphokinase [Vagococcus sp.]|uniref:thiamine diphosphokinase n=1 Tax=Vagococcus sp. TaxID=1933889 RepID=UPI003F97A3CC
MVDRVVIIAGGNPELWPDLTSYQSSKTVWIGVDRGCYYGLSAKLPLTYAVGDFDSVSASEWEFISERIKDAEKYLPEKDKTDTQLGLELAIERYPEAQEYLLIGVTGGRLDHFLANLWLPFQEEIQSNLEKIVLQDCQNTITYFKKGEYTIKKEKDKKYLAFVCLTPVTGLTLYDAKYHLDDVKNELPVSWASNEFIGETSRFSFDTGYMCVIQSKD